MWPSHYYLRLLGVYKTSPGHHVDDCNSIVLVLLDPLCMVKYLERGVELMGISTALPQPHNERLQVSGGQDVGITC